MVVASNPEALRESFQIADAILGPFAGRLANNGETLTFLDGAGRVLDEVSYEDENPGQPRLMVTGSPLVQNAIRMGLSRLRGWQVLSREAIRPGIALRQTFSSPSPEPPEKLCS